MSKTAACVVTAGKRVGLNHGTCTARGILRRSTPKLAVAIAVGGSLSQTDEQQVDTPSCRRRKLSAPVIH